MTIGPFVRGACAGMALALVAIVTSCYSPELRDCALTCSATSDCPEDQSCTVGFCVADTAVDCRIPATSPDATPVTPPAPRTMLHLTVAGHGRLQIEGGGTCSSEGPQNGDCMIEVARHAVVTLHAIEIDDEDHDFEKWTTTPCLGESDSTCQFTPSVPTLNLGAKFK